MNKVFFANLAGFLAALIITIIGYRVNPFGSFAFLQAISVFGLLGVPVLFFSTIFALD